MVLKYQYLVVLKIEKLDIYENISKMLKYII